MRRAVLALIAVLSVSCARQPSDCTSVQRDAGGEWFRPFASEPDSLRPNAVRTQLAELCIGFAELDSARVAMSGSDSLGGIEDLLHREVSLLGAAHAVGEALLGTPPGGGSSAFAQVSSAGLAGLGGPDLRARGREVETAAARQDSAARVLRAALEALHARTSVASPDTADFVQLELILLDSARTVLRETVSRLPDVIDWALGAVDSLDLELLQLGASLRALERSGRRLVASLAEDGLVPLPTLTDDGRALEFGWQIRRGIQLSGDVLGALGESVSRLVAETPDDSARVIALQLVLHTERLADTQAALERSGNLLGRVQASAAASDSVRLVGEKIRADLRRQHRILRPVGMHAAGMASTDLESARLTERSADLLRDVHSGLETSTAELLATAGGDVRKYGGKAFLAVLTLAVCWLLLKGLVWLLEMLAGRSAARRLFYKKMIPMGRLTLWGITIYIVLAEIFQLDSRGLLAAGTALGVAVGFAAQDLLKNIFGGLLIVFDQPFQVGDRIRVGGTYGEVVSMGLRSTRIVTPDDSLVSVPNAQVVDSQVSNANAGSLDCQVVVDLFVPGWVDVRKAKSIAHAAAANSRYVYLEKPIRISVTDTFKETFLTQVKIRAYVLDAQYEFAFASDVTEAAKVEFSRSGFFRQMESGADCLLPEGVAPAPETA